MTNKKGGRASGSKRTGKYITYIVRKSHEETLLYIAIIC